MSSRSEILNNEMLRLEKIAALKNDDVIELENSKRDLNHKIDQLQMDLLSWNRMHQGLMIHYLLVKRKTHQLSSVTAKELPLKR